VAGRVGVDTEAGPRPCPRLRTPHPLALLGSAELAASRLASPCAARRPAVGGGRCGPCCDSGVGGWPTSQASTAAIASACSWSRRRPASPPSSCTSMVNPGGPDRGRRARPRAWPAARSRAGGVGRGSGLGMRGSLLARPRRLLAPPLAGRGREFRSGSRFCLDHANQGVRAPQRPGDQGASMTDDDDDPTPRLHGEVALNVPRHRAPLRPPSMDPGPTTRLARVAQPPGSPCSPQPPGSHHSGGAAVRSPADHRPFTRSAARSSADHPPLGGAAEAEPRDTKRRHGGPAGCTFPSPARKGTTCATPSSHPVRPPPAPGEPGHEHQRHPRPQPSCGPTPAQQPGGRTPGGQGRSPSRASSPTSQRRPTPSSTRIRFTDHPCST
jgi:hypothetical protein